MFPYQNWRKVKWLQLVIKIHSFVNVQCVAATPHWFTAGINTITANRFAPQFALGVPAFIINWLGVSKMGAMKNLLMDVNEQVYKISVDLNKASESGDLDVMKQALRKTIVNSALAIAFIEELENNL